MARGPSDIVRLPAGLGAVAIVTLIHVQSLHVSNAGIVSTTFLMVVLTVTKREGATASQVPSEMVTARDSHA